MVNFSLRSILGGRTQQKKSNSELQIGDIVKFHGPVYARITSWEDFVKMEGPRKKTRYRPSFMAEIKDGEWVCLETSTSLYFPMPATTLERVNPRLELEQGVAVRQVDISFLERAIGPYKS